MNLQAKNYDHLLGNLPGFSEKQLKAHFGLYQGYVKKLNEVNEKLQSADPSGGNYSFNEYSELKRREAVPFNGAFLHELYFDNLAAPGTEASKEFKEAIAKDFGDFTHWLADLRGAAASTTGWVLTTFDHENRRLHNYLLGEHHIGLPVHQSVLMALDCWEHAYVIDYGTTKPAYLDSFLKVVNWQVVSERFAKFAACAHKRNS